MCLSSSSAATPQARAVAGLAHPIEFQAGLLLRVDVVRGNFIVFQTNSNEVGTTSPFAIPIEAQTRGGLRWEFDKHQTFRWAETEGSAGDFDARA
jgi:hypothetical protein